MEPGERVLPSVASGGRPAAVEPPAPSPPDQGHARIAALVARLRAARGPDRELDAEVGAAAGRLRRVAVSGYPARARHFRIGDGPAFALEPGWYWRAEGGAGPHQVPPYTALLDAALTLYPAAPPARVPSCPREACAHALAARLAGVPRPAAGHGGGRPSEEHPSRPG